jgi:uncharacterized protein (TIGR03086 family)
MTQQARPNPIELLDAGIKHTRKYVRGVKPADLTKSTPCTQWNVQQLVDHFTGTAWWVATALGASKPTTTPGSASEAYDAATNAALQAARAPGALNKQVMGPMGEMPAAQALGMACADIFIHGWDLAKATGQDTKLDPKLVDACHGMIAAMPAAQLEGARRQGAFGPEVKVPPTASTQDKLLGLTGRRP